MSPSIATNVETKTTVLMANSDESQLGTVQELVLRKHPRRNPFTYASLAFVRRRATATDEEGTNARDAALTMRVRASP
jgi:hypothetical protein